MNVSGFPLKSYKFTDQNRESRLMGSDLWKVSQSLPKGCRFLSKFYIIGAKVYSRGDDWAFYHKKIGTQRDVQKKGARLVHYAIGYEELGQMVKKYGDNVTNWPVLEKNETPTIPSGSTSAKSTKNAACRKVVSPRLGDIDSSDAVPMIDYVNARPENKSIPKLLALLRIPTNCSSRAQKEQATDSPDTLVENRCGGGTTNTNLDHNNGNHETSISPGTSTSNNRAYLPVQGLSPRGDINSSVAPAPTIDVVNALSQENKLLSVRLSDLEHEFYVEDQRGMKIVERTEQLEETVYGYGQSKKHLGLPERLTHIESMVFET